MGETRRVCFFAQVSVSDRSDVKIIHSLDSAGDYEHALVLANEFVQEKISREPPNSNRKFRLDGIIEEEIKTVISFIQLYYGLEKE